MISSINSSMNSGWMNLAAMNDMKLSQALSAKGGNVSSIRPIQKTNSNLTNDSAAFLKEYQANMTEIEKLAKDLSSNVSNSAMNTLGVTSSSSSVMDVSSEYSLRTPATYNVEVKQLAQSQINLATAANSSAKPTANGSFVLQTSKGTFGFDIDSSEAATNKEMFSAIAAEINKLNTGVTAKVVEDRGLVTLALGGNETGSANSFTVSGDFAQQTGLNTVSQSAQDAIYSVDKQGDSLGAMEYTSSSNTVTLGNNQINATLKKEGSSQVTVGTDVNGMADKLGKLVSKYNETIKFLDKNADRGIGVLQQMRRMTQPPTGTTSMRMAGITMNAEGTYDFDKETFMKAMEKNPSLIREIVGGDYGIAQGFMRDAQEGKNVSSANLVDVSNKSSSGTSQSLLSSTSYDRSAFQMLSSYTRSGAFNMTNYYAVGAMMNMLI